MRCYLICIDRCDSIKQNFLVFIKFLFSLGTSYTHTPFLFVVPWFNVVFIFNQLLGKLWHWNPDLWVQTLFWLLHLFIQFLCNILDVRIFISGFWSYDFLVEVTLLEKFILFYVSPTVINLNFITVFLFF